MAKCGNHGIVVPRDRRLLRRLYWVENRSLPEIGAMFGVTHKSIERVMRELGIPRRGVGSSRNHKCKDCGAPVHKIKHTGNGSAYGTRCKDCRREHYNALAREWTKLPRVKRQRETYMARWYLIGSDNPKGEKAWLTKGKHLLRNARRHLRSPRNREALKLRSAVSELVQSLQI